MRIGPGLARPGVADNSTHCGGISPSSDSSAVSVGAAPRAADRPSASSRDDVGVAALDHDPQRGLRARRAGRGRGRPSPRRASASAIARRRTAIALPLVLVPHPHRALLLGQERDLLGELGEATRRDAVTTRSTSSAVTRPSPEVVCSRTITWPLFSPPSPAPETCMPSRMYLSPTGVRTTVPPAASTACCRPPFESTDTTSVPTAGSAAIGAGRDEPLQREDAEDPVAVDDAARCRRPRRAGRRRRRARSRGRRRVCAHPLGEPGRDRSRRSARLMFRPSGWSLMTSTCAPVAPRIRRADGRRPSRSRSRATMRSPEASTVRGEGLAVAPRSARAGRARRRRCPRRVRRGAGELVRRAR